MYGADNVIIYSRIYEASTNVHLLATKTDLFGQTMSLKASEMATKDDVLFVGALLARIDSVLNKHFLLVHHRKIILIPYLDSYMLMMFVFCTANTQV